MATQSANYRALGLASDPNLRGARAAGRGGGDGSAAGLLDEDAAPLDELRDADAGASGSDDEPDGTLPFFVLTKPLPGCAMLCLRQRLLSGLSYCAARCAELRAALGKKRKAGPGAPIQRLTKMQRLYVGRLVSKHGENFTAMAKDIKLNRMQHTVGALRLLCRRWHAHEKGPSQTSPKQPVD
eukprot:SM000114S24155  [mRNA]  locus=s114:294629:295304:+ [translate_table: standard]